MKDKKKIGIIVGAVAVIIAVIIGVIASRGENEGARLQKLLDAGAKYLAELDYEQAVVAYNEAITLDPKNVDAYIGLAEAYLGMGDFDAAREALEAGYAATGEQIFQDWITSIWESSQESELPAEEPSESEEESVEDDIWGYVEFDFDPKDVTIMGYDLFDEHFEEVVSAFLSGPLAGSQKDSTPGGIEMYYYNDGNLRQDASVSRNEIFRRIDYTPRRDGEYLYSVDFYAYVPDDSAGNLTSLRINMNPDKSDSNDNPLWEEIAEVLLLGNMSYEEAAQLLRIDEIKEKGRPTPVNNEEVSRYYFKSNLGSCVYSEGMYAEEERISWHMLEIYYEDGKTFIIGFERRSNGLINDCDYEVVIEHNGYPDYLWTESWWESAFN